MENNIKTFKLESSSLVNPEKIKELEIKIK